MRVSWAPQRNFGDFHEQQQQLWERNWCLQHHAWPNQPAEQREHVIARICCSSLFFKLNVHVDPCHVVFTVERASWKRSRWNSCDCSAARLFYPFPKRSLAAPGMFSWNRNKTRANSSFILKEQCCSLFWGPAAFLGFTRSKTWGWL